MPTHSAKSESATAIPEPAPDERITAIVPVRDEETTIETCVSSLARQAEISKILVVNDQSTDRTAVIVRGLVREIRNLQVLEPSVNAVRVAGQNHSLFVGERKAQAPLALFVGAGRAILPWC